MSYKKLKRVNIEISSVCNLACSFCHRVERKKPYMDLDLFRHIVKQVVPMTEIISTHLMGEPLMHPQFILILEAAQKEAAKVDVTSNGLLIEDFGDFFKNPCVRQINISLQSALDQLHAEKLESHHERIFSFVERASRLRPDLFINFRLWNLKSLSRIDESGVNVIKEILNRFGTKMDVAFDAANLKKSKKLKDRIYLHFNTLFDWPNHDGPVLHERGFCYGLSSHFGVLSNGHIVPCCLDRDGTIDLGDAKNESIKDVLQKPRAIAMKNGFDKGILVEGLCKRCSYIDRFCHKSK